MFIAILTPVAVVIFDFFDIKLAVYGNYLFWFIAMALFNAILPFETKNIFIDVDPKDALPSATGPIGGPAPPKFLTVQKNDIIQGTGTGTGRGQWSNSDTSTNKNPSTYKHPSGSKVVKFIKSIPLFRGKALWAPK